MTSVLAPAAALLTSLPPAQSRHWQPSSCGNRLEQWQSPAPSRCRRVCVIVSVSDCNQVYFDVSFLDQAMWPPWWM